MTGKIQEACQESKWDSDLYKRTFVVRNRVLYSHAHTFSKGLPHADRAQGTEAPTRESLGLVLQCAHTLVGAPDPCVWNHRLEGRAGRGFPGLTNSPFPVTRRKLRPEEGKSTRPRARAGGTECTKCGRWRKGRHAVGRGRGEISVEL